MHPRTPIHPLPLTLTILLTACAGPSPDLPESDAPDAPPEAPATLELSEPTLHLDGLAREPMLVEHPDGTLFVAGYGSQNPEESSPDQPPNLWRSDDGGATWQRIDVGSFEDGAYGNSDVDLAVGPEGTLYFAVMGFDRQTFRGTHVVVGASPDKGETWTWNLVSDTDLDDRPWVRVTPDGTAHAIWNDGEGVAYARSTDRGHTWTEQDRIHHAGGSSHFAAGPQGELAVRIGPLSASGNQHHPGEDWIAVSLDGGDTWELYSPPGAAPWVSGPDEGPIHRWVEPLAWDASGDLYHLWGEGNELRLARSTDRGESWIAWTLREHDSAPFFPWLTAAGDDQLAATWYSGEGDDLRGHLARITVPESGTPRLDLADPLELDIWNLVDTEEGEPLRVRDTGGEYFPVIVRQDGELALVTTVQRPGQPSGFAWWTGIVP